ncbi:MAG: BMC domain-containing protein, partial [Syntrophothermus sp.]
YMVLIGGDVAAVQTAVDSAVEKVEFGVIDTFVIPNVHEQIFPAIAGHTGVQMLEALGIVESFSVASLIEAADAAVKAATVTLIEVRLAMALGGKAFFTCTGEVAAVSAAVEAGARVVADRGLLVNKVVIASPRQELLNEMI